MVAPHANMLMWTAGVCFLPVREHEGESQLGVDMGMIPGVDPKACFMACWGRFTLCAEACRAWMLCILLL